MMAAVYYPGRVHGFMEGSVVIQAIHKNRRNKYGIKLCMLSEPNGIILNITVYNGVLDSKGGKKHAVNVVLHLWKENWIEVISFSWITFTTICDLAENLLQK